MNEEEVSHTYSVVSNNNNPRIKKGRPFVSNEVNEYYTKKRKYWITSQQSEKFDLENILTSLSREAETKIAPPTHCSTTPSILRKKDVDRDQDDERIADCADQEYIWWAKEFGLKPHELLFLSRHRQHKDPISWPSCRNVRLPVPKHMSDCPSLLSTPFSEYSRGETRVQRNEHSINVIKQYIPSLQKGRLVWKDDNNLIPDKVLVVNDGLRTVPTCIRNLLRNCRQKLITNEKQGCLESYDDSYFLKVAASLPSLPTPPNEDDTLIRQFLLENVIGRHVEGIMESSLEMIFNFFAEHSRTWMTESSTISGPSCSERGEMNEENNRSTRTCQDNPSSVIETQPHSQATKGSSTTTDVSNLSIDPFAHTEWDCEEETLIDPSQDDENNYVDQATTSSDCLNSKDKAKDKHRASRRFFHHHLQSRYNGKIDFCRPSQCPIKHFRRLQMDRDRWKVSGKTSDSQETLSWQDIVGCLQSIGDELKFDNQMSFQPHAKSLPLSISPLVIQRTQNRLMALFANGSKEHQTKDKFPRSMP